MLAIILAAGYATRMYPLTEHFPKPLLEIGGRSILDWLTRDIDGCMSEYIVVSNAKFYQHFTNWAANARLSAPIYVINDGTYSNGTRLGAVKDIQLALNERLINEDVLVLAGDNVLDFSLGAFVDYAQNIHFSCIMRYYEPDENRLKRCGVMELDGDRVISMEEKPARPRSHFCAPPFYYYVKSDLELIKNADCAVDAPGSLAAYLCAHTTLYAMEMPGKRYDLGSLQDYNRLNGEYAGIKGGG